MGESKMDYVGSKWYKCDLHLHTTASKCFQDQTVTPSQWVKRVLDQGLDCIAITDHNTGVNVDEIKLAAQGTGMVVFPGVEITCDTSKIHLLVLFDINKSSEDIRDFLIKCDIPREMFGEKDAFTSKSIFEVVEIAHGECALVIPAHIDEFNGLNSVSTANLNKLYGLEGVNAVQVIHSQFLSTGLVVKDNSELKASINEYYNNPNPLDDAKLLEWYTPVKSAIKNKLSILTFSDNPHELKSSKHGLDGIGTKYTWIKMDECPSLEGLRQAFLLPDLRVKNYFECLSIPYNIPDLWIKSLSVNKTTITDSGATFKIDFSPQLNTIIGGRGSGKSSVLRFIRGVFSRIKDIEGLPDILDDQSNFYKKVDKKTKKGVLSNETIIEVDFVRNNLLYRIKAFNIQNSVSQEVQVNKFNNSTNRWEEILEESFIDFFEFEHYSQKQIYEIAQEPNSLRERIDDVIEGLDDITREKEVVKRLFLEKSTAVRTIQQQIAGKGKLQTEINDFENTIKLFQQSGIASLLTEKEQFTVQNNTLRDFSSNMLKREELINDLISKIELKDIDYKDFKANHISDLAPLSENVVNSLSKIKAELEILKNSTAQLRTKFDTLVEGTSWNKDYNKNSEEFNQKKLELEEQGIDDIVNFEKVNQRKIVKEKELESILELETTLTTEINERKNLQIEYLSKCKEITAKRHNFVLNVLQDKKVKISIKPFRNQADFIQKLRTIIQRETGFEKDIESIVQKCFRGNIETTIKSFREVFLKIRQKENVDEVSGNFVNLVDKLTDAQIDEIELLLPEDEIEVQYKPSGSNVFKPLSTASAGQKTTAILTFILSHGKMPLILDQPEDDLDNRLVYELVVDRLKQAKQNRQIIVVTHNANIPVNGDAEYIISMNSESKKLDVIHKGTVEKPEIKKEICDVMEGTEHAFQMRARRYKDIN